MFLKLPIDYQDDEPPQHEIWDSRVIRRVKPDGDGCRVEMDAPLFPDPDDAEDGRWFYVAMSFDALWALLQRVE